MNILTINEEGWNGGYHGGGRNGGTYGYTVFDIYNDFRKGIIVHELPENKGMSVTNSWPDLKELVLRDAGLKTGQVILWFEHYRNNAMYSGTIINETWDQVIFHSNDQPTWIAWSKYDVESLFSLEPPQEIQ